MNSSDPNRGHRPAGGPPGGRGGRSGPGSGPPPGSGPGGQGPGGPRPPSGTEGGTPPPSPGLRHGLREALFFFRYVRPILWMVVLVIALGLVLNCFRLPLSFVPMVLTAHFSSPPSSGQSADEEPVRAESVEGSPGRQGDPASREADDSDKAEPTLVRRIFGGFKEKEEDKATEVVQKVLDVLRKRFGESYLFAYMILCLSCLVLAAGCMWMVAYLSTRLGEHMLRELRMDVFGKIEDLSMMTIYSSGAGEFIQRLTRDLFMIRDLFTRTLSEMMTMGLQVLVNVLVLFSLQPLLTFLLLLLFGVVIPLVRYVNRQVEGMARQMQRLAEQILGQLVETVGGYRDLRASGRFNRIVSQFEGLVRQAEKASVKTTVWAQTGGVFTHLVVSGLLISPYLLFIGELSSARDAGRLITYVGLLSQVLPFFQQMARKTSDVAMATPSMQKVRQMLLEQDPARVRAAEEARQYVAQHGSAPSTPEVVQSIRLEGVTLRMGGRNVVEDLSFEIAGGKETAIVGPSGSGKTTIFHLLLRLVEPNSGKIWINGIALPAFEESALRQTIGFIPQNPFIFNTSIRENLLLALPEGEDEESRLQMGVELAQLSPLIESRRASGGLESSAGYMGMSLSAGERQRVALARLLLQDPKVVICDEYTANIDAQTATLIKEMMDTRLADRTRVVITHELATIRDADHIVVLEEGRVVDQGTHNELMARGGLYRAMADAQGE